MIVRSRDAFAASGTDAFASRRSRCQAIAGDLRTSIMKLFTLDAGVAAAAVLALTLGWLRTTPAAPPSDDSPQRAQAPQTVAEARQVGDAFVKVAEQLAPSVVRITIEQRSPQSANPSLVDPFEDSPFGGMFQQYGGESQDATPRIGMGSGVVIDDQGHILTNNHVVAHADRVQVTFVDGTELEGTVVGTDPMTDLAVLKVEGSHTKPAEFGDSDRLRVGEWVMAIGNPFGLDHSVTVGVLSAKGRYGFARGQLEDFLQTDASINPGNSGGPLVNLNGQVIGINTMIAGLGTGVGFAVSEAMAKPIARQLIEHGKVTRPYIGVVMQSMTPELRRALGEGSPVKGALVSQVQPDSPAEKAGLQIGDVIVSVGGKPTADSREIQRAVLEHDVGADVEVRVWRDGKEIDVAVRTSELPSDAVANARRGGRTPQQGLDLQTLNPEIASRLGVERDAKGAVVAAVHPGSAAATAGLHVGDVIVAVDRTPVANAEEAGKLLGKERRGGHFARVERGEATLFVAIPES